MTIYDSIFIKYTGSGEIPTPQNNYYCVPLLDYSQVVTVERKETFLAEERQPKEKARIEKKDKKLFPWHTSEGKAHLHDLLNDNESYVHGMTPEQIYEKETLFCQYSGKTQDQF